MPDQDEFARIKGAGKKAAQEILAAMDGDLAEPWLVAALLDKVWFAAHGSQILPGALAALRAQDQALLPHFKEERDAQALDELRRIPAQTMLDVMIREEACRAVLVGSTPEAFVERLAQCLIDRFAVALRDVASDYRRLVGLDPSIQRAEAYFIAHGMPATEIRDRVCALMARYSDEILTWYREAGPQLRAWRSV